MVIAVAKAIFKVPVMRFGFFQIHCSSDHAFAVGKKSRICLIVAFIGQFYGSWQGWHLRETLAGISIKCFGSGQRGTDLRTAAFQSRYFGQAFYGAAFVVDNQQLHFQIFRQRHIVKRIAVECN